MKYHRNGRSRPVPSLSRLAGAITSVLLVLPPLAMAQAAAPEPGRIGNAESWRTEEFKQDWGLAAIGADYAYARGLTGAGINVGVTDDGVAAWHQDLQGRVSGLKVSDPGCTSTVVIAGPNACYSSDGGPTYTYTQPLTPEQLKALQAAVAGGSMDQENLDYLLSLQGYQYNTHGTHVAGTIAANRNGQGSHGVAFGSNLHATAFATNVYQDMRVPMGLEGGTYLVTQSGEEALKDLFAQMEKRHVRVMNNSWGFGSEPRTAAEMDATAKEKAADLATYAAWAKKNDAIQVWAAGNDSGAIAGLLATIPRFDKDAEPYWLSVANLAPTGKLDSSSSICGLSKAWCITAPGTDIFSTIPYGKVEGELEHYEDGEVAGYEITKAEQLSAGDKKTGTSMAAPHVTGAVALLMERYPYLSSAQVRDVLLTTAKDLGDAGVDDIYGWGLMDLKKAIDGPGQMRVDTEVKMDRRAGGAKVWQGQAWDDWRNDIGGSGKLAKSGAGWLRLSGSNSFGGAAVKQGVLELTGSNRLGGDVQVQGGEFLLNGKLQDTRLDVQAGVATIHGQVINGATSVAAKARLQGTGTLAQTQVAGTVAPGVGGIGTLHVEGAYTQLPGSLFEVDLAAQGKSDLIDIRGHADLQGGQVKAYGAALGERYRILNAQSISGAFAGASSDNQPFLSLKLAQTANQVNLDVARGKALATAAFTRNQTATARGADGLKDDSALLKRLTQLSAAQATAAFDRISAETHASQRSVLLEEGYAMSQIAASRMRRLQDGFVHQDDASDGHGLWLDAHSRGGYLQGDGNTARSDYQSHGLTVGYDHAFGGGWSAGVLGGSDKGDAKVPARAASNEMRSRGLGLYAGKTWGAFGLRAGAAVSEHRIVADRQVVYGTYKDRNRARYSSDGQQAFVEAGYGWKPGAKLTLEPYAQWARVDVKDPGFQESGGVSALRVDAGRSSTDFATAGLRFSTGLAAGGSQDWLQVNGGLAYRVASGDVQPSTLAAWPGGNAFATWGAPISKRATVVNLNAGARLGRHALLEVGYDGQFGSEGQDHSVNARLSLDF